MTSSGWKYLLQRALDEYYAGLWKALADLSQAERRYRTSVDANHIDFLVWHMARNEDDTVSACAHVDDVWSHSDLPARWGLRSNDDCCGFTSDEVGAFPVIDIDALRGYFSLVRARTDEFLGTLQESMLDELVWTDRPDVTMGQLLGHLVVEQSQHLGQVAMIRGLQRGSEFTTSWNNPQTPSPG